MGIHALSSCLLILMLPAFPFWSNEPTPWISSYRGNSENGQCKSMSRCKESTYQCAAEGHSWVQSGPASVHFKSLFTSSKNSFSFCLLSKERRGVFTHSHPHFSFQNTTSIFQGYTYGKSNIIDHIFSLLTEAIKKLSHFYLHHDLFLCF